MIVIAEFSLNFRSHCRRHHSRPPHDAFRPFPPSLSKWPTRVILIVVRVEGVWKESGRSVAGVWKEEGVWQECGRIVEGVVAWRNKIEQ